MLMIDRIRNGEEDAFRLLLKRYHRMIYRIINSFRLENGDYAVDKNDLYQEASLALYHAAFTFQRDRNTKFSSYVFLIIRSRLINVLREYHRTYEEEKYSIDNAENLDHRSSYCIRDNALDYHRENEFKEYLDQFLKELTPEDRTILAMRVEDCSYQQIAQRLQINTKRVDNRLRKLRIRLRDHLEREKIDSH